MSFRRATLLIARFQNSVCNFEESRRVFMYILTLRNIPALSVGFVQGCVSAHTLVKINNGNIHVLFSKIKQHLKKTALGMIFKRTL